MPMSGSAEKPKKIEFSDGGAIPKKDDIGLFTAWRVTFVGAISIIAALVYFKPDPYLDILKSMAANDGWNLEKPHQ
ncbi:hypothetical protein [Desulfobacter hydrogenophilus]|uniref:hypothetical protein n=2 Tax=Desulfobacter hydrogenophilus TaxID=2291 RepID=UPI001BAC7E70|nr:hypothetical protein [Desulfobacter hydrogenophilus]